MKHSSSSLHASFTVARYPGYQERTGRDELREEGGVRCLTQHWRLAYGRSCSWALPCGRWRPGRVKLWRSRISAILHISRRWTRRNAATQRKAEFATMDYAQADGSEESLTRGQACGDQPDGAVSRQAGRG